MSSNANRNPLFQFFFERTVPAVIWVLLLVTIGYVSYNSLTKEALPDLEIPTFYVTTEWEGANSAMVEKKVTKKIEDKLRGMKGLKRLTSASSYSTSLIVVTFEADCRVRESLQLVQQKLALARGDLPRDAKQPRIEASSVNDQPSVTVVLYGDVALERLEKMARDLEPRLEKIAGVRKVRPVGLRKEVVSVQLLPDRLKSLGIPATLVRQRIVESGVDAPWGRFDNAHNGFTMKMDGTYDSLADLDRLLIRKLPDGGAIRLEDVAEVRLTHRKPKDRAALSWEGGEFQTVVALDVLKVSGGDTVALVDKVRATMGELSSRYDWPSSVEWRLTGDQSEVIISELERGLTNGWQSVLVVFLVLFVLLTWREALVAAICVPLTLLGTLGIVLAMGYTFNLLVLIGMVIALGLLVDDFILIMEGMHEALFVKGMGFVRSVRHTIKTYAIPSFSGSITTIIVFAPLAFIGGIDGKFMRVIPVTAAACLVSSYIVSIFLGPPLLRLFLRKGQAYKPGRIDHISHWCESRLAGWLGRAVVGTRKKAWKCIAVAAALFVMSVIFSSSMRVALYNKEDGRTIGVSVELAEGTTLEQSEIVARKLGSILRDKDYIEHVMRVVGDKDAYSKSSLFDYLSSRETPHVLGFGCFLVPRKERDKLGYEYVQPLRREFEAALAGEPGVRVYVTAAQGGPSTEDPIQVRLTGDDFGKLREIARQVQDRLSATKGIYDVRNSVGPLELERRYRPVQDALEDHGLSVIDLGRQVMAYMENEKVGNYQRPGTQKDLDIRLGTWWESQGGEMAGPKDWNELSHVSIINGRGESIPLESVAVAQDVPAEGVIIHSDSKRSITVLTKMNGIYESEVFAQLWPFMEELKAEWPAGYTYEFVGVEDADNTYSDMFIAFCAGIILVYAILALLFDSLFYPAIILSTVLFALVGVFIGFTMFGLPFSFSAAIGIVALVGIVVNDAIIVIETIRNRVKKGESLVDAARFGAADRLRPVVSTTLTNLAGLTPLALSDPGWAPICQAIIFGEITATFGAVVLIPALFVVLTSKKKEKALGAVRHKEESHAGA